MKIPYNAKSFSMFRLYSSFIWKLMKKVLLFGSEFDWGFPDRNIRNSCFFFIRMTYAVFGWSKSCHLSRLKKHFFKKSLLRSIITDSSCLGRKWTTMRSARRKTQIFIFFQIISWNPVNEPRQIEAFLIFFIWLSYGTAVYFDILETYDCKIIRPTNNVFKTQL